MIGLAASGFGTGSAICTWGFGGDNDIGGQSSSYRRRQREEWGKLSIPIRGTLKEGLQAPYPIFGGLSHSDITTIPIGGRLRLGGMYRAEMSGKLTSQDLILTRLSGGLKFASTNIYKVNGKAQISAVLLDLLLEDD
jgi:hypothetical protein